MCNFLYAIVEMSSFLVVYLLQKTQDRCFSKLCWNWGGIIINNLIIKNLLFPPQTPHTKFLNSLLFLQTTSPQKHMVKSRSKSTEEIQQAKKVSDSAIALSLCFLMFFFFCDWNMINWPLAGKLKVPADKRTFKQWHWCMHLSFVHAHSCHSAWHVVISHNQFCNLCFLYSLFVQFMYSCLVQVQLWWAGFEKQTKKMCSTWEKCEEEKWTCIRL